MKEYDIVVFAATGFTGSLISEYLAKNVPLDSNRWALAARNKDKLQRLCDHLKELNPNIKDIPCLIADVNNQESVDNVCRTTRLVISAVGPYAVYGEPIVKSCVANKTDYIDVTGEPGFIRRMIDQYHADAVENNVMVVHCCGIDSIPADLTTYFALSKLREKLGNDRPVNVETFISLNTPSPTASLSNGTWTTVIQSFANIRNNNKMKARQRISRNKVRSKDQKLSIKPHWADEVSRWAMPFPVADPFVVKRSSSLQSDFYGDFEYAHYAAFRSILTFIMFMIFMIIVLLMSQLSITRSLLYRLKKDGEGPPEEIRDKISFKLDAVASEVGGQRKVMCRIMGGEVYTETAHMAVESALCMLNNRDHLPLQGGILTPAAAMGQHLLDHLRDSGVQFSVVSE